MSLFDEVMADTAFERDFPFGIPSDTWTMKGGARIKIKDMTTQHIRNCMKMVGEDDPWYRRFKTELEWRGIWTGHIDKCNRGEIKEAIEILRDTPIDLRSPREDDIHTKYATAMLMAQEALEKCIPCTPGLIADGYWNGELEYDTWVCPHCGKCYEVETDSHKHCPNCGQKIEWRAND